MDCANILSHYRLLYIDMEAILIILFIGFVLCYFIRHPLKSMKYTFLLLTFFVVGSIVVIGLFYLLVFGANI